MPEEYDVCPICTKPIDPDAPDAILSERVGELPGFGQGHIPVWSPAGYAHKGCLARDGRYRPAAQYS